MQVPKVESPPVTPEKENLPSEQQKQSENRKAPPVGTLLTWVQKGPALPLVRHGAATASLPILTTVAVPTPVPTTASTTMPNLTTTMTPAARPVTLAAKPLTPAAKDVTPAAKSAAPLEVKAAPKTLATAAPLEAEAASKLMSLAVSVEAVPGEAGAVAEAPVSTKAPKSAPALAKSVAASHPVKSAMV